MADVITILRVKVDQLERDLKSVKNDYEQLKTKTKEFKQTQRDAFKDAVQNTKKFRGSLVDLKKKELELKNEIRAIAKEEKRLAALQASGAKGYTARLDRVRKMLIKTQTEQKKLTQEIRKTEKSQNKLGSSFKKLGGILLATFAVSKVISFGKESLKLFNLQEQAEVRLLTALKGKEDVQKRLISQARVLQDVSLFGDEEIIAAQSLIAAFTDEEQVIKDLTRVTLDFATAKGFALPAAAELVSKTFASSTNSLTRYGIQVDGAAGSSERLTSIIEALDAAFLGQAEAAGNAGTGNLIKFNNQIKDIKETIGGALLPVMEELAEDMQILFNSDLTFAQKTFWSDDRINDYLESLTKVREEYEKLNQELPELVNQPSVIGQILPDNEMQELLNNFRALGEEVEEIEEVEEEYVQTVADLIAANKELNDQILELNVNQQSLAQQKLQEIEDNKKLIEQFTKLNEVKEKLIELDHMILQQSGFLALASMNETDAINQKTEAINQQTAALQNQQLAQSAAENAVDSYSDSQIEGAEVTQAASNSNQEAIIAFAGVLSNATKFSKDAALAQVLIQQAVTLANAASSVKAADPITYVALLGAILGAVGTIFGTIKANAESATVPTFADGVIGLQGAGTETSDSIHAMLSKGESVMTAKETRENRGVLEAIRGGDFDNKYISKDKLSNIAARVEESKNKSFADNIANSMMLLDGLDNHSDLYDLRRKSGKANYLLESIDSKITNLNGTKKLRT